MLVATGSDPTTRERIEAFSRASADHLGRAMRMQSILVLATIGALVTFNTVNPNVLGMTKFSSPLYVIVVVAAIARWLEARRALRVLVDNDVTVTLVGDVVLCELDGRRAVMRANRWLLERSRRHGLPRASL